VAAFDLVATMDGLSALLVTATIAPNNYAYPVGSVTVPCTVVGYPTTIDFDTTFVRGGDRAVLPLWHVVGKSGTKDARDALSAVLADASSVKSALDGLQSFGSVRVTDAEIAELTIAAITHIGVKYTVEVYS
jgi:hypothetical protein